ncbi:MAG: hypothetical protein AB1414_10510 [bacterium]
MNEMTGGILCGGIGVIFLILYRGLKYGIWKPALQNMIVIFLYGVMIPFGCVLISFSLFGKPEIDIAQYKIYFTIAGIAVLYVSVYGIIEEIRPIDKK